MNSANQLNKLNILYRGKLKSCNYSCWYCPFGKKTLSQECLQQDRDDLDRFVQWATTVTDYSLGIFFIPWGEAFIHSSYQQAMVTLSHAHPIHKVAIQTNLSFPVKTLQQAQTERLGLWATYHPNHAPRSTFVRRCYELHEMGISFSVGMVGLREHLEEMELLRTELPRDVYLWINAYKHTPNYYSEHDLQRIEGIDPLFRYNLLPQQSKGKVCTTGSTTISVDGDGNVIRCNFVQSQLGNIYETNIAQILTQERCPNETCHCHIGYIYMPHLDLLDTFGDGVLERAYQGYRW
jgi:MoaA/NifB/PqqE/SkfB family radical SAM enzyme